MGSSGTTRTLVQRCRAAETLTTLIRKFEDVVRATDRFEEGDVQPILLGLFGEVGSIMTAVKKLKREEKAYTGFRDRVVEELGDAFWYLTALCRRYEVELEDFLAPGDSDFGIFKCVPCLTSRETESRGKGTETGTVCNQALIEIGRSSASLLGSENMTKQQRSERIKDFIQPIKRIMSECDVTLEDALSGNISKVTSRFGPLNLADLPDFDANFPEYEQLPREFRIELRERDNKRVYLRMNDVFIGDPLTDSISQEDGFRYHDVIHLAHAAVLHWSPTVRALLKRKRKSHPEFDESQDGGRGVVIEEGLAALVFSKAKELDYFEGHTDLSFDLLKTIQEFVRGYEVEACPLKLWETCILNGYHVFRLARINRGGIIIGDRHSRKLLYEKLP